MNAYTTAAVAACFSEDTSHMDLPTTIKLLATFKLQMQLDILQYYLLNLMTISWGKAFCSHCGTGQRWSHNNLGSYRQIQPRVLPLHKAPGCLGNPLKFLMCDRKSSFLRIPPACSCPLPSCSAGQNREVETGDQKSVVTVT